MRTRAAAVWALAVALAAASACHRAEVPLDHEDAGGPDSGTDADTDVDTDTDSDIDTDTGTDSCPPSPDCESPIEVPDEPLVWEYSSDWACFEDDSFDSYMTGCSESDGTTAWFAVGVPVGHTLEVEKVYGATAGINLLENCDATHCMVSDINHVEWVNPPDSSFVVYRVAIETDIPVSAADMIIEFGRYPM